MPFKKGHTLGFKKGYTPWNKGLRCPHSEETKRKIGQALRGRKRSLEARRKQSKAISGERNHNFGKPKSEETKRRIGLARKGIKHTKEAKKRMSESHKQYYREHPNIRAKENNPMWRGGNFSLGLWVRMEFG